MAGNVTQIIPIVLHTGKESPTEWSNLGSMFDQVGGLAHV
jgi:hypothetical protein